MFIHKLGGSWIKHPFLRNKFLLDDSGDLKRIHQAGIKEIWIDESKGLARQQEKPKEEVKIVEEVAPADSVKKNAEVISMHAEIESARKICNAAKEQVKGMFEDVRMGKAFDPETTLPMVGEINTLVQRNSAAILSVARLKTHDDYTYMHSVAVCALMLSLAKVLGLDEKQTELAGVGGLMHDLGKALMPIDILNKPGKLTDAEFISVKEHPAAGAKILIESGAEPEVVDIALHHHEKVNGKGYPDGLAGDEISLLARMGAICDVYDAVTSERAYKKPWDPSNAIQRMAQWEDHFDKALFAAFVKSIGIYPVGALVRLSSKRLAVVIEPGVSSLLKPKVKSFFSLTANAPIPIETVDLAAPSCKVKIEGPENPDNWKFKDLDKLWLP